LYVLANKSFHFESDIIYGTPSVVAIVVSVTRRGCGSSSDGNGMLANRDIRDSNRSSGKTKIPT
jgi:hypothetical protein